MAVFISKKWQIKIISFTWINVIIEWGNLTTIYVYVSEDEQKEETIVFYNDLQHGLDM